MSGVVILAVRIGLAMLFAVSATAKLASLDEFRSTVDGYRLLPAVLVGPVAVAVPMSEAGIAAGLFFAETRSFAALAAVLLLCVFSVAVAVNLLRGRRQIDCGCFGPRSDHRISWLLVMRNGVLIVLAALCLAGSDSSNPQLWIDYIAGWGGGLVVVILFFTAGELESVRGRIRGEAMNFGKGGGSA